jgi:hypothetical protein
LVHFDIFFLFWSCCTKNNLATLTETGTNPTTSEITTTYNACRLSA